MELLIPVVELGGRGSQKSACKVTGEPGSAAVLCLWQVTQASQALTISALQMRHRGLKILASLAEMELKPRHEQEWLPEGLWQCCGCRFYSRSYRVASDRSVASGLPCK